MCERDPEILDKRDLENHLEDFAARCIAEGQKVDGGVIERFYKHQRKKWKFQPTVTRRQINYWLEKWNKRGGPRRRTGFIDRIDGGEY